MAPKLMQKKEFIKGSNASANYDWTDIASGIGYETFYAAITADSNILSPNIFYSDYVSTKSSVINLATYMKVIDADFDVQFIIPRTIKGRTIINVPMAVVGTAATQYTAKITAKVRKWDGTTETEIAENDSHEFTEVAAAESKKTMLAIDVNIPITHFKSGEYLRLTIEAWGKSASTADGYIYIGHDPKSRATQAEYAVTFDWGTDPSSLIFNVPFRIEI